MNLRKGLNREFLLFMSGNNSIYKLFNIFFKPVVDTIFPPVCFLCDSLLINSRKVVCKTCWSKQNFLSNEEIKKISNAIINTNINDIYILYDFTNELPDIIHLLKYERCLTIGKYFSKDLLLKYKEPFFKKYDFILPIPLHPVKHRERGYNQCFEIIKHLPGNINNNIVTRKKQTISQTTLTREERIKNMSEAFQCKKDINSSKVLLFDDIITTGSTINECAGKLLKCGASKVDVLCLAAPLKHAI